jgi:Fe-S-cluster containining protein
MTYAVSIVERLLSTMDASLAAYIPKMEAKYGPVSCRTCTAAGCCRQLVLVQLFEVIPLVARLQAEGRDTLVLRDRLRRDADDMDRLGVSGWYDAQRPCLFLSNERCSVYAERPFACRALFTVSPASDCWPPRGELVASLACVHEAAEHALRIGLTFHEDMGLTRHQIYLDVMPRVVLRVLAASDEPTQQGFLAALDAEPWPTADAIRRLSPRVVRRRWGAP